MADVSDRPSVVESVESIFDNHGTASRRAYDELVPVDGSAQRAQSQGNAYVGHVAYSPDFDSLVYQMTRSEHHILQSIDGRAIAIDETILTELVEDWGIDFVLVGKEESHAVFVFPVESFDNEVPSHWSDGFGKQIYANMREDMTQEITDAMGSMFSEPPQDTAESIPYEEAINR